MKKVFKIVLPIILALVLVLCMVWYLFVYDRAFTRDILLSCARFSDRNNKPAVAAWFYDLAYNQSVDSDEVAIELAQQHKADGNFTQAEVILSKAIEDGGSTDLYIALCRTYVEQDKLLDAVKLLNGITNPDILKVFTCIFNCNSKFFSAYTVCIGITNKEVKIAVLLAHRNSYA